jgi:hypothetical protein
LTKNVALELKQFLRKTTTGIREEEEDFKEAIKYYKLEEDLKALKEEGWVRVVKTGKEVILYPCDLELAEIEVRPQYPMKSLNLIQNIWNDGVNITNFFN